MTGLFFLLSGEHEDLPFSELKAILETEGYHYRVSEKLDQVARLDANEDCLNTVVNRAAFVRVCCLELFSCRADTTSIVKAMRLTCLSKVLKEGESFAVRVKRVRNYAPKLDVMAVERELGEIILNTRAGVKVNLRKPDKTFIGIITDEKFAFGVKLAEIPAKPFVERRPRKKPFFHPSAMQAKLARCMVNLAKPKAGDLVLDPFCGTGTMLIEATLVGCRSLGLDVQRRMVRGTIRNLAHFKLESEGVIVADARNLPLVRVDCVVTDPPYGISSTTMKRTVGQIVKELLSTVHGMLDKGQRVCMAAPKTLKITQLGTALGYKHLESHLVYVHRSLTREIVVFEKV